MKFTKMSLVAALLVGSSAFAIDNVKASGDAKLYYSTADAGTADLFNRNGAAGQAAASLNLSADLASGISAGSKVTVLTTLGLQGQLVNNVWEGTNVVSDSYIVNDLWVAATVGKTTAKIGRMELDTPLVFTEKWSIIENTFEAAVVINQDIPNTTLVGAYVGGSNGTANTSGNGGHVVGIANVVDTTASETTFTQFYNGAFAVGAINNSFEPLTLQAWYYDATSVVTAYWAQADLNMAGVMLGALYTSTDAAGLGLTEANGAFAVMAGYAMKDMFTVKASYSAVDDKAGIGAGGNLSGSGQSKMYTEAWWNYGYVTRADTTAYNVTLEAPVADIVDLGLYYTGSTQDAANIDMSEITLTASKSFGPLDTSLVYINTTADDQNAGDAYSTIQAYLTYNY